MAKTREPYTAEFKEKMVALALEGRSPESLAKEFEPSAQSIHNWVAKAQARGTVKVTGGVLQGLANGQTAPARPAAASPRGEVAKLREEIAQLRAERDFLLRSVVRIVHEQEQGTLTTD